VLKKHGLGMDPFGTRAALYARVSTTEQKSIPMQLEQLRDYASRRQWTVVLEKHEARSGADASREARGAVLDAARRREIDVVLVWKLDRWGRSVTDLVTSLAELQELGVSFVSLTEGFDLTTSAGRALAHMLAVFAEFERDVRRERVHAGMARARREGKHLGRPSKTIDLERRAHELARRGVSRESIAQKLRVSRTTVWRMLQGRKNGTKAKPVPL
jgi:putative DNA-invertase from lambdoid prophage Rac